MFSFVRCHRLLGKLSLDSCQFDAERAFVLSSLDEDVFIRLPQGCGKICSKILPLNRVTGVEVVAQAPGHSHKESMISAVPR